MKGKIVLCDKTYNDSAVLSAGGAGVILGWDYIDEYTGVAKKYALPATLLSTAEANKIKSYINSTR